MTLRLTILETRRIALRTRFWVIVAAVVALGIVGIVSIPPIWNADQVQIPPLFQGVFSHELSHHFVLLTPLLAGVISAGSLAEDRRRGYHLLILQRGVTRMQYLLAKAVATFAAAALAGLLVGAGMLAAAALLLQPGRFPWVQGAPPLYGPLPSLLASRPVLHDLLTIAMIAVGAGGLASLGIALGALIPNEYIIIGAPFLVVLGSAFVVPRASAALSPYTYVDIKTTYPLALPVGVLPYAAFVYWLGVAALSWCLAYLLFTRREVV